MIDTKTESSGKLEEFDKPMRLATKDVDSLMNTFQLLREKSEIVIKSEM